jgi:hypothetical protein
VSDDAVHRDYRGAMDLPELVRFSQRIWTPDNRWHIGDLAWDLGLSPEGRADWRIALWERGGQIVGVGWLTLPDQLSVVIGAREAAILDVAITWAEQTAGAPITITVLDREKWLVDPLVSRGYAADLDGHFFVAMTRGLADLPAVPALPGGYAIRPVGDDLGARAALHRGVWGGAMTDEVFGAMTRRWPYQRRFDWVVQAPDGTLVSYLLGWYDEVNRVGEFEPVGTLADYRRKGLSRAAGIALLHAFRDAGGERALVYARGDDDYPIPRQVYAALGFGIHGRTVRFRPKR